MCYWTLDRAKSEKKRKGERQELFSFEEGGEGSRLCWGLREKNFF